MPVYQRRDAVMRKSLLEPEGQTPDTTYRIVFTSMLFGFCAVITGLWSIFAIPYSIFAFIAAKRSQSEHYISMARVGIVSSIVGVGSLMLIYAAYVKPLTSSIYKRVDYNVCTNRIKQISLVLRMYAEDNDGRYPLAANWQEVIKPTVKVAFYKYDGTPYPPEYAVNKALLGYHIEGYDSPTNYVVMFDSAHPTANAVGGIESVGFVHRLMDKDVANIGYADGHAKSVTKQPSGIKGIGLLSDTKWKP